MAKTELESRSKQFALAIIDLVERMPKNRANEPLAPRHFNSPLKLRLQLPFPISAFFFRPPRIPKPVTRDALALTVSL